MAAETGAIGNELYSWLMMADAAAMTTTPKKVKDMGGNESTLYLGIGKVGFNEAVAMTATSTQLNALVANNSGSNTGDQDLSPYLLSATAASTYLTQANASSTYATQASLSSYLTTAAAVLAYQPLDSDLTTIAGLTVSNDDFLQRKAGVWVNRTVAQVKTDLSLSGSNTGDQTITLTGNVTGSGTGSFATTIANGVVTVAMLSATGTPSASTFLRGDGSWAAPAGGGGGDLLAANNLSDLANAATARTNLGLVIGTNVQAYNANLTSFATVTPSANGLSLVSAANYAAMKTLLSLTIGTDVQAYNANLTTYAGIAPSANVQTLLGSANYAAFKTSLSLNNVENTALSTWAGTSNITTLGTISTGTWNATTIGYTKGGTGLTALGTGLQVLRTNSGATAMEWATISAGGGDMLKSDNLSGLTDYAVARTNMGLAIGTDVQAYNANLTTYAGIAPSANVQTLLGAANYAAFKTSLSLNNVENTALSTWAGSTAITTLGTVTTGTLSTGAVIGGVTMTLGTDGTGDMYYRSAGGVLTRLAAGTNGHVLTLSGGLPSWAAGGGGGGSTFADNVFQVYDSVDNTKILAFEAGSITTATTRTLTIPDASGTIVLNDNTATLSGKTLTAPKFASGGFIADANGNELLEFESVASAVNHLKIVNDITNGDPYIEVAGTDANVGMYIVTKGNGFFALDSTTQTTGSSRGQYAVDLQIYRTSSSQASTGAYSFSANGQNTASGAFASAFGNNTIASGQTSLATGQNCSATAQETFVGGFRGLAYLRGQLAWSGGQYGATGDNQFSLLVARRSITGVTTGQTGITLYLGDGSSTEIVPGVTGLTYRTWTVRVQWNVVISATSGTTTGLAASDTVGAMDTIVLKKTGSTVTIEEVVSGTVAGSTNLKTGLSMGYTASGTNFRINLVAPTFAGGGSLSLRASADLFIAENGY